MTETLALLFAAATAQFGLPDGLLSALCFVESSHRVEVVNTNDGVGHSIGVCQIKLNTAKLVGYRGTERALKKPKTNIHYAAKYLRRQLTRYSGDVVKAVAAYNAGSFFATPTGVPRNLHYVKKVFKNWESLEVYYAEAPDLR